MLPSQRMTTLSLRTCRVSWRRWSGLRRSNRQWSRMPARDTLTPFPIAPSTTRLRRRRTGMRSSPCSRASGGNKKEIPGRTPMDLGLRDQVVVITGAGRGIGAATARMFAEEGAKLAIWDRDMDSAATLAGEIGDKGGAALPVVGNVGSSEEVKRVVEQ